VSGIEDLLDVETDVRDEQERAILVLSVNLDFKIRRLARTLHCTLSLLVTCEDLTTMQGTENGVEFF
jgi:hypothetical protein